MLIYSAICVVLLFRYVHGEYKCTALDQFEKVKYFSCDIGCCGNLHNAYCCDEHQDAILIGSIVGGFILVVIIIVSIHCWYRKSRRQPNLGYLRETRNYGTMNATRDRKESVNTSTEQLVKDERLYQR
ncbi:uncharacterized protein LOC123528593 [Mercenaria mercenaria]|uniref:uncharacterized protein LOC123528593 n=1 Tax=Mercenaria mercenaria TaxID=6596 RepID=UPI00234E40A5|nr:uncharacterized protein LOC123528593 [Mercenaria mercenaria]